MLSRKRRLPLLTAQETWADPAPTRHNPALRINPHLHCIVPGGGISPDGERWVACRPGFFLPVRVLSRLFRRLFLEGLTAAFTAGELQFFGDLAPLNETRAFAAALLPLRTCEWFVFAKKTFPGPEQVLAYLARYTHRVAITNSRLLALDETHVSLSLEGVPQMGWSQEQGHAPGNRRVHSSLSPPRPAEWLPSYSPLRLLGERPSGAKTRTMPKLAERPSRYRRRSWR